MAIGEDDFDRAAILSRRRRFVAVALGGLGGVGCQHELPTSDEPAALHEPEAPPSMARVVPEPPQGEGLDEAYASAAALVEQGELDEAKRRLLALLDRAQGGRYLELREQAELLLADIAIETAEREARASVNSAPQVCLNFGVSRDVGVDPTEIRRERKRRRRE